MRLLSRFLTSHVLACLGFGLLVSAAMAQAPAVQSPASEVVLTLNPSQSKVHWTLDSTLHAVHGTFALKNGSIRFDPQTGKASGEIVVLAPSGESGNSSRDARMHKEILETEKYPEVVFRPEQVAGQVTRLGASDVKLTGIFSIHGSEHALTADVHAELVGDRWSGVAKFEVPYVNWGIKDPSTFLLKARPVADVDVEMSGEVKTAK
jgi:polyisoprenoid-binding protein YceI